MTDKADNPEAAKTPLPVRLRGLLTRRASDLRQAVRITVAVAAAYASYKALDLQQGYWAVFTVLIVMQGSIGSTLSAAVDRLIGTMGGAFLGGFAVAMHTGTTLSLGIALVLVTALATLAAGIRPQLRIASVTAAILLLTAPPDVEATGFVIDRIVEIAIGGVIAVLATVLIFPARSHGLVVARAATVLDRIRKLLLTEAEAVERGEALAPSTEHVALRQALSAVEQAMKDAERERASHLADHDIPPAIPRTLWRVRNDLVAIGAALNEPLPGSVATTLGPAGAALLRAAATLTGQCAVALRAARTVERGDTRSARLAFANTFDELRRAGVTRALDFETAGRVFGLGFTLERLHRDLSDLADRIDEIATGQPAVNAEA
ncbi:MAG: FUSC family protein [Bradyrhizobiaceae bacterium]|nr:MAG: FUSC family protein [Bradyrhizobiaceae bacterium]